MEAVVAYSTMPLIAGGNTEGQTIYASIERKQTSSPFPLKSRHQIFDVTCYVNSFTDRIKTIPAFSRFECPTNSRANLTNARI